MTIEQDVTSGQEITAGQMDLPKGNTMKANQDHIAILELGSGVWSEWRKNKSA